MCDYEQVRGCHNARACPSVSGCLVGYIKKFITLNPDGGSKHRTFFTLGFIHGIRTLMLLHLLATLAATAHGSSSGGSSSSLSCFVEYASSSTVKNACERAYYEDLAIQDAGSCSDKCVADKNCIMFLWSELAAPRCRLSSTCKAPTNALPGYQGYFRNSTVGVCDPKSIPVSEMGNVQCIVLKNTPA